MNATFEPSARSAPSADYSRWTVVKIRHDDGSRMEYGFFPDQDADLTPAYVSHIRRKSDGNWGSVEFWDARFSDEPCPDIPESIWAEARSRLAAPRSEYPALHLCIGLSTVGAAGVVYGVWAYLS